MRCVLPRRPNGGGRRASPFVSLKEAARAEGRADPIIEDLKNTMKVICSYCRKGLGKKERLERNGTSHGMCEECYHHFSVQLDGLGLVEYLDRLPAPVVIVDGDARVIAANRQLAGLAGKERDDLLGQLMGDVMECAHGRLPEGCGKTEHCFACGLRLAVRRTLEEGRPCRRISAHIDKDDGRIQLLLPTVNREHSVEVREDFGAA